MGDRQTADTNTSALRKARDYSIFWREAKAGDSFYEPHLKHMVEQGVSHARFCVECYYTAP